MTTGVDLLRMPSTEALLAVAHGTSCSDEQRECCMPLTGVELTTVYCTQVLSSRKNKHALFSSTATLVLGIMGSAVLIISGARALPYEALAHVHM